jgi:hypothetical protein
MLLGEILLTPNLIKSLFSEIFFKRETYPSGII